MNFLILVEPFFIRNSMTTYQFIANRFARSLEIAVKDFPELADSVRIFCNQATAEGVRAELGVNPTFLMSTNSEEEEALKAYFLPWSNGGQQLWVEHMRGTGGHVPAYHSMLNRIRSEFPFDAVLAWGTNRTLVEYTRKAEAVPLFSELGPLRPPFPFSGVLDSYGVNGDASVVRMNAASIRESVGRMVDDYPSKLLTANIDIQASSKKIEERYVLIPLQTADDANLLIHNSGIDYEESLLEVAATASRLGTRPVVKTHPGAKSYKHTNEAEQAFLARLKKIPNALVIDKSIDANEYLSLLKNADGVFTFNSSVGFEASLLGTPTCVLAKAGYAPAGSFAQAEDIYKRSMTKAEWLDRMKSIHWLMTERYLLPLDEIFNARKLASLARFWSRWRQTQITPAAMISEWTPSLYPAVLEIERPAV